MKVKKAVHKKGPLSLASLNSTTSVWTICNQKIGKRTLSTKEDREVTCEHCLRIMKRGKDG